MNFLQAFDAEGRPNNLSSTTVPAGLLDEVNTFLPERRSVAATARQDWIREATIDTVAPCTIKCTFLSEGAGYRNSLGYIVYPTGQLPKTWKAAEPYTIIFPNASLAGKGGSMAAGDTLDLAYQVTSTTTDAHGNSVAASVDLTFPAGVTVAFVVLANMWNGTGVRTDWWRRYFSTPGLNPETDPKLKHHSIVYRSAVDPNLLVFGMEDINRDSASCDHDFNDVVFYATVSSLESINTLKLNSLYEQRFQGTLIGDNVRTTEDDDKANLNFLDFVSEYDITETLDGAHGIHSIRMTFHLPYPDGARKRLAVQNIQGTGGSSKKLRDQKFCLYVPGLGARSITRETYSPDSGTVVEQIQVDSEDRLVIVDSMLQLMPVKRTDRSSQTDEQNEQYRPCRVDLRIVFPATATKTNTPMHFPYPFRVQVQTYAGYFRYNITLEDEHASSTVGVDQMPRLLLLADKTGFGKCRNARLISEVYPKFSRHYNAEHRYSYHWFESPRDGYVREYVDTSHSRAVPYDPWLAKPEVRAGPVVLLPVDDGTLTWAQAQEHAVDCLALLGGDTAAVVGGYVAALLPAGGTLLDSALGLSYFSLPSAPNNFHLCAL